jgi:hypothetical protein
LPGKRGNSVSHLNTRTPVSRLSQTETFRTGYLGLERDFLEFTSHVPLIPQNLKVISPRFGNIASLAGNWIETAFKRMAKSGWPFQRLALTIPAKIKTIDTFRDTFEVPYHLSSRKVFVKRYLTEFHRRTMPFEQFRNRGNPIWFHEYSRYKHDRLELQRKMTLRNVTDAMAGLFLLNVYPHEMREYLLDLKVIHSSEVGANDEHLKQILLQHPSLLPYEIPLVCLTGRIVAETQLFIFEFPVAAAPNSQMEKENELDAQWEVLEQRRRTQPST